MHSDAASGASSGIMGGGEWKLSFGLGNGSFRVGVRVPSRGGDRDRKYDAY